MKSNCIFCDIAQGKMASTTIFETGEFRVILDKFPATKGHVLILPKEHIENIFELDVEQSGRIFALATAVAKAMKDALDLEGLNVLQNNGAVAGQTVQHFHIHLIPRYKEDHVNITWSTSELDDVALEAIGEAIAKKI